MALSVYVRSKSYQKYLQPFVWFCFLFVLALSNFLGLSSQIDRAVGFFATPILSVSSRIIQKIEWPFDFLVHSGSSARRVQQLEQQYAQSIAALGLLEGVADENEELRKLLENTDRRLRETRVAGTLISLSRPAISVGSDDQVKMGNVVLADGIFVGTVTQVQPVLSFVTLLSQPDHQPILAKTQQGTKGIIVGTGRTLEFQEVSLQDTLSVGDRILTVGQPGIAADLTIGQVVRISGEASSPVKEAQVDQIIDFYQTKVVEIVL